MTYRMTIGDFSRISNLSPKALRLYDKQGILKPVTVDPITGYRYYTPMQVIESERIRILRSLDMPLEEIRSFLDEKDPTVLRERLGNYRVELEKRVMSMRRNMDLLDQLTEKREEIFLNYVVVVKEVDDQPVISTRIETSISKIGDNMARAFSKVCEHMAKIGITTDGVGIALYHCQEFDPEHLDIEVAMAVDRREGLREDRTGQGDIFQLPRHGGKTGGSAHRDSDPGTQDRLAIHKDTDFGQRPLQNIQGEQKIN